MHVQHLYDDLLVRPRPFGGESQWGFWLRLASENGLQRPHWLLAPGHRSPSSKTRLCPECLREPNAMWRQEWQAPETYWCRWHLTWLADQCPSCRRHLRWNGVRFLECFCACDFRMIDAVAVDERILVSRTAGSISHQALRTLGAFSLHGSAGKPGKKTHRSAVSEVRAQLEAGICLIENWPEGFVSALDRHRRPPSGGSAQLLAEAFPRLNQMTKQIQDLAWRDRVVSEIDAYCSRTRSSHCPILGRNSLLRETPMTLKQIATHLGCRVELVARAVDYQAQKISAIRTTAAGRRRRVIGEEHLPQLATLLRDPIELKKVARLVALPVARLRALVCAGLLVETEGRLSRSNVLALDAELRCRISTRVDEQKGPTLTIRQALRCMVRVDQTEAFFLALRTGDLNVWAPANASPIGSWAITKAAVADWLESSCAGADGAMTLTEAAEVLSVKHDVVRDLIRVGLLKAKVGTIDGRRCRCLAPEDVASFKACYVALAELTKSAMVRTRDGFDWAVGQGMQVVTGSRVDGARQYFVKRSSAGYANAQGSPIGLPRHASAHLDATAMLINGAGTDLERAMRSSKAHRRK